jgi:hypothetical protein
MVKMLSLLRGGIPGRRATNVPLVLPAAAFPEASGRRGSVSAAAYVKYCMPDYDSCFGPDSSVG